MTTNIQKSSYPAAVKYWIWAGLFMLFVQVIVGGVTRLTGSGLSITKWEVVSGTIPPMNEMEWQAEFDLYKDTPQYREINEGMSMSQFKFIYFWEYIHRFWARLMGFVFVIPLIFFWARGMIDSFIMKKLGIVVLLAALAASFGWIMVASGLIERPWVNAYKLAMHLSIAFMVYAALLWTYLTSFVEKSLVHVDGKYFRYLSTFLILLSVQIFIGGVMSGMKAGVVYPTWPDMNGEFIPHVVFNSDMYTMENFNYYDQNELIPALVHVLHRSLAYILFGLGTLIFVKVLGQAKNWSLKLWFITILLQVALGIWTVISCIGTIPVLQGVLHQAGALILLTTTLVIWYQMNKRTVNKMII